MTTHFFKHQLTQAFKNQAYQQVLTLWESPHYHLCKAQLIQAKDPILTLIVSAYYTQKPPAQCSTYTLEEAINFCFQTSAFEL